MHDNYHVFLTIAIFLLLSNLVRIVSARFKIQPVIGIMLLGLFLGPSFLKLFQMNDVIKWVASVGVVLLLFEAGLETDLKKIRNESRIAFLPALGGIIVPFISAFLLSFFYTDNIILSSFVGTIFAATSVSVSVLTLFDLDKLRSIEGRCIINSAIIDDILGILIVTFLIALIGESTFSFFNTAFLIPLGKIFLYFGVVFLIGIFIIRPLFSNFKKLSSNNSALSIAIAIIFLYSWYAELSGIAAITGSYLAGMFLGQTDLKNFLSEGIGKISRSLFIDIFFISIGLSVNLFSGKLNIFYISLFVILAVLSKIFGAGLGARLSGLDFMRSFRIGSGLVPRGEVALIIANIGIAKNIITENELSATIILVIISGIITPFLLRFSFKIIKKKTFEKDSIKNDKGI